MLKLDRETELAYLRNYHCPRYAELLHIPLYRDQLLNLLEQSAGCFYPAGEPPLTSAMVNNYVKQRLLAPPVKKRYDTDHLAVLFMVSLLKQILSIDEIRQMLKMQAEQSTIAQTYDAFGVELEAALAAVFQNGPQADAPRTVQCNAGAALMRSAIRGFAHKIFVVKALELETARMLDPMAQMDVPSRAPAPKNRDERGNDNV